MSDEELKELIERLRRTITIRSSAADRAVVLLAAERDKLLQEKFDLEQEVESLKDWVDTLEARAW